VLEPVPVLGVFLFVQVLIGTALLRGSESIMANALYERVSPYVFGEQWLIGCITSFVAALVLAMIWKWFIVRHYYIRCTTKRRRKRGLDPEREPVNVLF
jgi:hypothetical protein